MNRKLRLLLVDDEAEILELLTLIFRDCDSKTALNAESALEALRGNDFDVLITDIKMPGGLGLGLIDSAKQISPNLAVIVITGHYQEMPKDTTERVHRWILKPFTSQAIREAVLSASEKL
jgi:DNA-binding NtrC family response regulator